jgi:hypothetical protein
MQRFVVRKPFSTAELAIKAREAITSISVSPENGVSGAHNTTRP